MADTAVAITAGTGTNIDTRTEGTNSNHRQVIVIGDPATNAGVAPVDVVNGLAVQVIPALPAGTNAIGKLAANSGVDIGDVDVTSISAGTNLIGDVGIQGRASGGLSKFHLVSAGSDNATNVKASAGTVYGISVFNLATYPIYVKFHNTAGTPTAGTGVVETFGVQAGVRGEFALAQGSAFSTGIGICILKSITDAGSTAVLASDCVVDIYYK